MSARKRKKYSSELRCVSFPDDVGQVRQPPSLSSSSSARSWEKCGESFLNTPGIKNLKSPGRKQSAIRKLPHSQGLADANEDPVNIAWSSSDSGGSDDEKHLSRDVVQEQQEPQRTRRLAASIHSYTQALQMLRADKDDVPVIDTDSDLDEFEEDVESDSGQQISDCESDSFAERSEDVASKPAKGTELEISGYVSDGENVGDTTSRLESESFPLQTGEGSKRSVSAWVRSAHAMLQTPQKRLDKQSKTPEDSGKKRRKFQRGGLAERLNRLQCRQRSAISFWRHQSISDSSAVSRPGVLVLKVQGVQGECSMQLVLCTHHPTPGEGPHHSCPRSEDGARVLVLFNRETAAQLSPAPDDIIHIYPPWQSLSMERLGCDVILNTHFSQKVYSASKAVSVPVPRGLLSPQRCSPYSLCQIFRLVDVFSTEENNAKQVAAGGHCSSEVSSDPRRSHSLLEAIEGLGQAGSVRQDVAVVIQRVYSIHVPDCSPVSVLKSRIPSRSSSAPPPAEKDKTRLCALVQDSYGMFSVIQLHLLPCKDDLHHYCQAWQGKTCVLRGIKVVQRVTRERSTRLFSLIDSLWPPAMPVQCHGNASNLPSSRPPGPAPSFCYLLSGQESSVESDGQTVSPLHLPPTGQPLRNILQNELKNFSCTFMATVLFRRTQGTDVGQGEVWLLVTDPSLQEESPQRPGRRTVALRVSTSCVLTSSVLKALNSPSACRMLFRDAIKEHDVLVCVEHSVVELCGDARPADSLTEPLPQPVRLDPLGLETTPNSLCTLTGVIVGVDEHTAYSWPTCNLCGSDNLETLPHRPHTLHCGSCKSMVEEPVSNIQLEVFLSSAALSNCTLKVKLQQKTIMSILNMATLDCNEFPGCDVESVLGKELGPLAVYVRVVTRKPAFWMSLEEICL